jgi:isoquinoline 1-oxidoreductase subunit beta
VAWRNRIVGQSIVSNTPFAQGMVKNGIDVTSVEGATTIPYAIPNLRVELTTTEVGVPVLWWRSVGSTHTAYAVEAFIDEVAEAAGKDPVALRLELLREHPRHAGVLKFAAEKAGWDRPLPSGRSGASRSPNPSRAMWRRSPRSSSTRAASQGSIASYAPSIVASRSTRT